jgi:hypothetical protein
MAEQPTEKSVALNKLTLPFTVAESNISAEGGNVVIRIEFGSEGSARYSADAIKSLIRERGHF